MTTDPTISSAPAAGPDTPPIPVRAQPASGVRKWAAFGTGVGIEIRDNDLHVSVVRVRPGSASVIAAAKIADVFSRPAAEWGNEVAACLRKAAASHIAATVLLPRRDVIVRQVHLPGVADRDLASAVALQVDTLHPFADDEVYHSWARLGSSPFVLVGIVRRDVLERYYTLFTEAGVKIGSCTYSAAVLYAASRLITQAPPAFVVATEAGDDVEVYGESESRPAYSATLPLGRERAISVGRSELRLDPEAPELKLADILPMPLEATAEAGLPFATALAGACPWLSLDGNLLPPERRRASSRVRLIPTVILGTALTVLLVMLALQSRWADARYLGVLQHEIRRYEPRALRVAAADKDTMAIRARTQSLDEFRRRAKLDMDALAEATKLLPPPGWVSNLDMDRATLALAGETDQAAELLKRFDGSPLFERSEFTMPISRGAGGEMFRIRTQRQTPPLNAPNVPSAPPPAAGVATK